jgi:hypothetical protein
MEEVSHLRLDSIRKAWIEEEVSLEGSPVGT